MRQPCMAPERRLHRHSQFALESLMCTLLYASFEPSSHSCQAFCCASSLSLELLSSFFAIARSASTHVLYQSS